MLLNNRRAKAILETEGIDGFISATIENNYYLSGMWSLGQELFPRDAETYVVTTADKPETGTLVCSIAEADLALTANEALRNVITFGAFFREIDPRVELTAEERRLCDITESHKTGRQAVDALLQALKEQGLDGAVVAVDERGPARDLIARLREHCPNARFLPGSGLMRRIRAVKTDEEVRRLLGSLRATEAAFLAVLGALEEGITEQKLKQIFEQTIIAEGARPGVCLLRFGRALALGQIPSGDTRLRKGEFVWFDGGCDFDGYKSDIGRIASFGEPRDELVDVYTATKAGQQAAIDVMKPGVVASDVFSTAVEAVRDAGLASFQRNHVGHGIGIEYYDMPILTAAADTPLEAGMVFEVETPYYKIGVGGSFIEDTVLVTDEGSEILTKLDRELVVVQPG